MHSKRTEPLAASLFALAAFALALSYYVAQRVEQAAINTMKIGAPPVRTSGLTLHRRVTALSHPLSLSDQAIRLPSESDLAPIDASWRSGLLDALHVGPPSLESLRENLQASIKIETPVALETAPTKLVVLLPSEPQLLAGVQRSILVKARVVTPRISVVSLQPLLQGVMRQGSLRFATDATYAQMGIARKYEASLRQAPAALIAATGPKQARLGAIGIGAVHQYNLKDAWGVRDTLLPKSSEIACQLGRLIGDWETRAWAWTAAYQVGELAKATPAEAPAARVTLESLEQTAQKAALLAERTESPQLATEVRRARWALERRLATWSAVTTNVDRIANSTPQGRDLMIGARWAMSSDGWALPADAWQSRRLPLEFDRQATRAMAPSIRLAQQLEEYESKPSGALAREIVADAVQIAQTDGSAGLELAKAVEQHYRNANVRVAISQDLINRLLPQQQTLNKSVNDRIAGAPVRGRSSTTTNLQVKIVPDDSAWRLGLEARGLVTSKTSSRGGPAVLHSRGSTTFVASKPIVIDAQGIKQGPTQANASTDSRLVGLSTTYDGLPLFGSYARSIAKKEYARARSRARREIQHKVTKQVARSIDSKTGPAIERAERRYQDMVLARASDLGLEITPIEMRTTESRLIARLRVAGPEQLAAHTPRMRAPSDSLMSVQVHESALNNALEGIGLDGKRMTNEGLRLHLAERLQVEMPNDETATNEKAILHFQDEDSIRVSLDGGKVKLTLALKEMVVRGGRSRDFKVHVYYRPLVDGAQALLVQEGTPQIEGKMRTTSRLRLHGALGKVLGEDRRIQVVRQPEEIFPEAADRLRGIATTQFVIEDGWIGVAIGPISPLRTAAQVGFYVR